MPSKIEFDEIIDITKYVHFPLRFPVKYRIACVCNFIKNNYIVCCWNREKEKWYKNIDSSFCECNEEDIYSGNPYLFLYEKI